MVIFYDWFKFPSADYLICYKLFLTEFFSSSLLTFLALCVDADKSMFPYLDGTILSALDLGLFVEGCCTIWLPFGLIYNFLLEESFLITVALNYFYNFKLSSYAY